MPLAIQPSDFSQRVTDVNRHTWTLGTIRYVVAALDGAEVTVVVDERVGSAVTGKLVRAFDGGPARGPRLAIESEYAPGETQITNFWLPNVGVIIEMGAGAGAKFRALDLAREDESMALSYVRAQLDHEYAWAGSWTMRAVGAYDQINVSREVKKTREFEYWTVSMNQIRPMVRTR